MKLIRPNNYPCFRTTTLLLTTFLFISFSSKGQDVYPDSSRVEVSDTTTDSTASDETPNYFDYRTYGEQPDTIQLRHVPVRITDSLKNENAFWYANAKLTKKRQESPEANGTPAWLKISVWVVVIGTFLAALIWYLASSNILIFAKTQKQIISDREDGEIPENIFSINYQREIERAITAPNYRLAIRLMFLRLLRNLSNKNVIQYKPGRTNFEYLSQLSSTRYYNDFFRLTRNYEYAWYGKFDVTADAFAIIKNDFENFDRTLR
jgi:hypothetical protein